MKKGTAKTGREDKETEEIPCMVGLIRGKVQDSPAGKRPKTGASTGLRQLQKMEDKTPMAVKKGNFGQIGRRD